MTRIRTRKKTDDGDEDRVTWVMPTHRLVMVTIAQRILRKSSQAESTAASASIGSALQRCDLILLAQSLVAQAVILKNSRP